MYKYLTSTRGAFKDKNMSMIGVIKKRMYKRKQKPKPRAALPFNRLASIPVVNTCSFSNSLATLPEPIFGLWLKKIVQLCQFVNEVLQRGFNGQKQSTSTSVSKKNWSKLKYIGISGILAFWHLLQFNYFFVIY